MSNDVTFMISQPIKPTDGDHLDVRMSKATREQVKQYESPTTGSGIAWGCIMAVCIVVMAWAVIR
jgi:hypothetical protein